MFLIVKYKISSAELIYSLDIILKEFLGFDYTLITDPNCDAIEITQKNSPSKLSLNADFFKKIEDNWLKKESMPETPLQQWQINTDLKVDLIEKTIPILYGQSGLTKTNKHSWDLNLDIFGSAFFMLSRYEEEISNKRDIYDRFPAVASVAYQEGFLNRPIINEYTEILWHCLKSLFPKLERKTRNFKMMVSCDVDHPYSCIIKNPKMQLRQITGDLLKRKKPLLAIKNTLNFFATKLRNFSFDSYHAALYKIMDINEKAGNKVIFYFIAGHTGNNTDGCYSLDEPVIRKLFRDIHQRGHIIGLHPSFETYQNKQNLHQEANSLRKTLKEEGIHQKLTETRQHYLRWRTQTIQNIANADLKVDSTLSYTDHTGFRCGVCYQYPLYDLSTRKITQIIERPLIIMEATVIYKSETVMGYGRSQKSIDYIKDMKKRVQYYDGDFTLLWHNSELTSSWDAKAYRSILVD